MARYHFDFRDEKGLTRDEIGAELPNLGAARKLALTTLGEIARDITVSGVEGQVAIEVRDADGLVLVASASLTCVFRGSAARESD
ncbi:hypothetical protein QA641_31035 [Bradyrhizobium sp. CB1650]|uniref:DUF6894 family protein n=1 Tax=Bradyrhizobium sp. CB1650 TaxID=3039153 RepID=UPI002435D58E|nr:hypothetical protein [Bradyrhizobium sp. CB1650]WGD50044.1 hypothetical protein QA641_31035 [Bradyrhizobium sp. CB1650]